MGQRDELQGKGGVWVKLKGLLPDTHLEDHTGLLQQILRGDGTADQTTAGVRAGARLATWGSVGWIRAPLLPFSCYMQGSPPSQGSSQWSPKHGRSCAPQGGIRHPHGYPYGIGGADQEGSWGPTGGQGAHVWHSIAAPWAGDSKCHVPSCLCLSPFHISFPKAALHVCRTPAVIDGGGPGAG